MGQNEYKFMLRAVQILNLTRLLDLKALNHSRHNSHLCWSLHDLFDFLYEAAFTNSRSYQQGQEYTININSTNEQQDQQHYDTSTATPTATTRPEE